MRGEAGRERYSDRDLELHLALLGKQLDESYLRIYRMRCAGLKIAEIRGAVGMPRPTVDAKVIRIRRFLAEVE